MRWNEWPMRVHRILNGFSTLRAPSNFVRRYLMVLYGKSFAWIETSYLVPLMRCDTREIFYSWQAQFAPIGLQWMLWIASHARRFPNRLEPSAWSQVLICCASIYGKPITCLLMDSALKCGVNVGWESSSRLTFEQSTRWSAGTNRIMREWKKQRNVFMLSAHLPFFVRNDLMDHYAAAARRHAMEATTDSDYVKLKQTALGYYVR